MARRPGLGKRGDSGEEKGREADCSGGEWKGSVGKGLVDSAAFVSARLELAPGDSPPFGLFGAQQSR